MHIRHPSSAMVVALLALFVALSGTAVAAGVVPLAKRALVADNAKKLNGFTAKQIATVGATAGAQAAAESPGPASTAASLVTIASAPFTIPKGAQADYPVTCPAGSSVLSGGITYIGKELVLVADSRPTSTTTWSMWLINLSDTSQAAGMMYAVCLK